MNVGIICGQISKTVVIDIDGPDAMNRWNEALETFPSLEAKVRDTYIVSTNRGIHIYLRINFPVPSTQLLGIAPKEGEAKGQEIALKGDKTYVVGAGSLHPSGKFYVSNGKDLQTLERDEYSQLLQAFETDAQVSKAKSETVIRETKSTEMFPKRKKVWKIFRRSHKVYEGQGRHHDVLSYACHVYDAFSNTSLSYEDKEWLVLQYNEQHCEPPIPEREVKRLCKDADAFTAKKGFIRTGRKGAYHAKNPFRTQKDFMRFVKERRQGKTAYEVLMEFRNWVDISIKKMKSIVTRVCGAIHMPKKVVSLFVQQKPLPCVRREDGEKGVGLVLTVISPSTSDRLKHHLTTVSHEKSRFENEPDKFKIRNEFNYLKSHREKKMLFYSKIAIMSYRLWSLWAIWSRKSEAITNLRPQILHS